MLAILAAAGLVACGWAWWGGERIPTNDGLGFDGLIYGRIVEEPGLIVHHGLDLHRIQRIVPSLMALALLAPFGLDDDHTAIVVVFQVLNYLALLLSCLLWWQIARRLAISRAAAWIGFIALFVNYPTLKLSAFYPVLTDRFGFLLGVVLVWLIVMRRSWPLLAVGVLGSFTWPTVTYSAMIAFVVDKRRTPMSIHPLWGIGAALVAAAVAVVAALRAHSCGVPCVSAVMVETTIESLFPLSVALLAVWTFFALQPLAARLTPAVVARAVVWQRIPLVILVMFVIGRIQHQLATQSEQTISRTLSNTGLGAVVKPLGFLVTHATYYGPAVLLLVFTWRIAVRRMSAFGPGMVCLLVLYIALGVSTESRILVNQWPFFALAAALVVDELGWSLRKTWIFGAVAVVVSRAWLPIHHGPITLDWSHYPAQWYFMSNGPTTTTLSYTILTGLTLVAAAVTWWLLRSHRTEARAGAVPPADGPYPH